VWAGGDADVLPDAVIVVDRDGRIAALGPAGQVPLPDGLRQLGGQGAWDRPGVVDAHVHLAFGDAEEVLAGGVVAVRDLGAPPELCAACAPGAPPQVPWPARCSRRPGLPSTSWGAAASPGR
jgi:predicted amidohydrolase YtcJ